MTTGDDCQLLLEGECAVHQAFSVFTETFTIALGDRSATFRPNRQGRAETSDALFEATNASQYGVVYGGVLKFQIGLLGKAWCDELRRLNMRIPVRLDVGKASHKSMIELEAGASK
jgi:hypothetical protein